ncbi:MAG: CapA family protein [Oscillospiraceae bacterium]|nr:CapA family protein [Oscillospiraceae bacterium]
MNPKRLIITFACVFAIALAIGIALRIDNNPHNSSLPADNTLAPEVTEPDISDNLVTTTEPEVTTSETTTTEATTTEAATTQPEITTTEEPLPEEVEPVYPEDATVRICIGGDTSIDSEFAEVAYRKGVDYPWAEVSEVLNAADLSIVNLETCVSTRGVSEKKEGFGFRTPPDMLEGFVNAGIDLVNLANNHTRDFGYDALLDTFMHLSEYGIDYFGAGNDYNEAAGLVVKEVNGVKIGFTGCNRVWLPEDYAAAEGHAGINQVHSVSDERTKAYLEKVKEYDSQCDVLIVFLHYGTEEVFEITSYQERMSKALIDAGADMVMGGHSHTLQPIEFYNGKPIFYSIGNFIFWHVDDDIDGLTVIFDITVNRDGFVSLKVHPLFIKSYKVYYLSKDSERYTQIINLMNTLCNPYGYAFDIDGNMTQYVPPVTEELPEGTDSEAQIMPSDDETVVTDENLDEVE